MTIMIHKSTGVVFKIDKVGKKTVYMTVLENPNNCPGIKVGMKQKTSPMCIVNQFTEKTC